MMSKKELLFSITKKDFDIQTFRGSGPGGQHRNKTDSAVRIIHRESGAVGQSCDQRSQLQNKRTALERLTKTVKFKVWHTRKVMEVLSGETIEEKVNKAMHHDHLKVETKDDNGRWA